MITVGKYLREKRIEKGLSLDEISRITYIHKKYLEAIEEEDFSKLPEEPYVSGFLRRYAEALGEDPEKIINIYKKQLLTEQNIPEDLILGKQKLENRVVNISITVISLVIVASVLFFIFRGIWGTKGRLEIKKLSEDSFYTEYQLKIPTNKNNIKFRASGGGNVNIKIKEVKFPHSIQMEVNKHPIELEINQSIQLLLPEPNIPEMVRNIKISLEELSTNFIILHLTYPKYPIMASYTNNISTQEGIESSSSTGAPIQVSPSPLEKIKLQLEISGPKTWIEVVEDDNTPREYIALKGDKINVEFKNQLIIRTSNLGFVNVLVGDKRIPIYSEGGAVGEAVVKTIRQENGTFIKIELSY